MLDASEFQALLVQADAEFVELTAQRLQAGAEKYGPLKFFTVDTLEEAMAELLDLSNYARMTYIKLYILRAQTNKILEQNPNVGDQGFVPMKDIVT